MSRPRSLAGEGTTRAKSERYMTRDTDPVKIPHAPQFEEPILQGTKDATLRLERYDVQAGDEIIVCDAEDGDPWALAEVAYTFTCRAGVAYQVLETLNARHALTTTEQNVIEILDPHYDQSVHVSDIVQGIRWEILQRVANASQEGDA